MTFEQFSPAEKQRLYELLIGGAEQADALGSMLNTSPSERLVFERDAEIQRRAAAELKAAA